MLTKNISQIFRFPAFALLGDKLPNEVAELLQLNDPVKLAAAITPDLTDLLSELECTLPTDLVKVEAKLGIFLFDCYLLGVTIPNTPMGTYIASKRAQELAQLFELDEFEIPSYALLAIRNTLSAANLWLKIQASVYVLNTKDKKFMTLSSQGISYYNEIMLAATAAVYDPEKDK